VSIKGRVQRLQARLAGACPECGLAPDERRPMAVVYEEYPERGFQGDPYEACAGCGEPLYTVLRVVYEGEEGGGGLT
jgi:hypothetical protein